LLLIGQTAIAREGSRLGRLQGKAGELFLLALRNGGPEGGRGLGKDTRAVDVSGNVRLPSALVAFSSAESVSRAKGVPGVPGRGPSCATTRRPAKTLRDSPGASQATRSSFRDTE
jgi:hypothetical protein